MNYIKIITGCLLLLSSFTIFAQSTPDQVRIKSEREGEEKIRKKEYEKQKEKMVNESIDNLKEELQLDELQFVAIKQIIVESVRTEGIILKKEESDEDKMSSLKSLSDTTDARIRALLNKGQIEKFEAMRLHPQKKKKKK